jgi:hypothetical protein
MTLDMAFLNCSSMAVNIKTDTSLKAARKPLTAAFHDVQLDHLTTVLLIF